ncbi:MAG: hypothetical protein WD336_05995, partial [Trueperaceae bacterium]
MDAPDRPPLIPIARTVRLVGATASVVAFVAALAWDAGLAARLALVAAGAALLATAWLGDRWAATAARAARYRDRANLLARAAMHLQRLRAPEPVLDAMVALLADLFRTHGASAYLPSDTDGSLLRVASRSGRRATDRATTATASVPPTATWPDGAAPTATSAPTVESGPRTEAHDPDALDALAARAWSEGRTVDDEAHALDTDAGS